MTLRNPALDVNHNDFAPSLPSPPLPVTFSMLASIYELAFSLV